jgi:hypothetical protein
LVLEDEVGMEAMDYLERNVIHGLSNSWPRMVWLCPPKSRARWPGWEPASHFL